ncbi:MAG: hypothetical protein ACTH31_04580 [Pseudoclavibacter sp.]
MTPIVSSDRISSERLRPPEVSPLAPSAGEMTATRTAAIASRFAMSEVVSACAAR